MVKRNHVVIQFNRHAFALAKVKVRRAIVIDKYHRINRLAWIFTLCHKRLAQRILERFHGMIRDSNAYVLICREVEVILPIFGRDSGCPRLARCPFDFTRKIKDDAFVFPCLQIFRCPAMESRGIPPLHICRRIETKSATKHGDVRIRCWTRKNRRRGSCGVFIGSKCSAGKACHPDSDGGNGKICFFQLIVYVYGFIC